MNKRCRFYTKTRLTTNSTNYKLTKLNGSDNDRVLNEKPRAFR